MKYVRSSSLLCLLLAALLALSACGTPAKGNEPKGKSYFTYFDTVTYVFSYAEDSTERFDSRSAEVSAILGKYHRLFDIYHEYSEVNNLCTVNKNAGGEPVKVEPELIEFLDYASEMCELTSGEMNIMLGSVLSLWHNAREAAAEAPDSAFIPTEAELSEAEKHTDISLLEIDRENMTVRISDENASIDVGALGKGYATEKAAQYLEGDGADGYVLNVGGNIRIIGTKPDGSEWTTAIRDPNNSDQLALSLLISDTSCVTSGIYERFFMADGLRYHHIIDKDTLFPAEYYASVTILTPDSGLADCLSTALFCMPYEESRALADSLGVDAVWIFSDGSIETTDGAKSRIIA